MEYTVAQDETTGKWCVHQMTDGQMGKRMRGSCRDTKAEAEQVMADMMKDETKSLKCMDEYVYVPYGVTSIADAMAAEEAKHQAHELRHLVGVFQGVVDNILWSAEVADKGDAIEAAAKELAAMLRKPVEMKSAPGNPGDDDIDDPDDGLGPDDLTTVKFIGENRIGNYAVLWGNENKRDLYRQWFTPDTRDLTAIFDATGKLPLLYDHAMNGSVKTAVVGVVDTLKMDDTGLWYEAELRRATDYDEAIRKLIRDGKLKTSSQTLASAMSVSKSGHIEQWVIAEISLTPTPAEPRMAAVEVLRAAFTEIGCDIESMLAPTPEGDQGAEKARLLTELERAYADL